MYYSVLAAIAKGNNTRGGIASYLARPATDLAHPLGVLEDAGLISRQTDLFRANRSFYRIAEPLVAFYHAVMRPVWGDLERPGRGAEVWRRMRQTFTSKGCRPAFRGTVPRVGPLVCRPETIGGYPSKVGAGALSDRSSRAKLEADVVALSQDGANRPSVLCLGEAKWNTTMTVGHLDRLIRIREVLQKQSSLQVSDDAKLALFSGVGFTDELRELEPRSSEIVLVDLDRLYHGR